MNVYKNVCTNSVSSRDVLTVRNVITLSVLFIDDYQLPYC